jgi:uncharacterized protein
MSAYDFTIELGHDEWVTARHYEPDELVALGVTYVLAPGASRGHDSPFIVDFAERLSGQGLDVVTFNFPFLQRGAKRPDGMAKLEACYLAVLDRIAEMRALAGKPVIVGGKSMGGRIASFMAARPDGFKRPIVGLIFLGYPLHSPQRPEQLNVTHLPDITVPMLFVQGTRDPFGTAIQLDPVLSVLKVPVRLYRVMGGDHSFSLPKKWTGAEPQVFAQATSAIVDWVMTVILERARPEGRED